MTNQELRQLQLTACDVRKCVLTATHSAKSGHPGGSLSAADLFTYLYFHELRIDPKNPKWADRDRFVLSKGHTAPGLYAALALKGKTVAIYADDVALPEGEYFDVELEGCAVMVG